MKHKYALYPMILSSCALACFLAVLVLFSGAVQPLWGRIAVLLLPALLLAAVAFFAARGKLSPSAAAILTTVLAIVLFLGSVVGV